MKQLNDFDLRALYEALDAQRKARGISWAAATREMHGDFGQPNGRKNQHSPRHPLSPSTVKGTCSKSVAEGDGVLAMLRWLNRMPESFVPGHLDPHRADMRLPEVPIGKVLRFHARKLYWALDAQRVERNMTWARMAREMRVSPSMLIYLAKGSRVGFPHVMRYVQWLGRPAAEFTRASDR